MSTACSFGQSLVQLVMVRPGTCPTSMAPHSNMRPEQAVVMPTPPCLRQQCKACLKHVTGATSCLPRFQRAAGVTHLISNLLLVGTQETLGGLLC